MKNCGGEIPSKKEELLKVPGVGEYTAGAILSIAFNQPEPAVDGNVIRVLSRLQTVYQTKTQMSFLNWCKRTTSELVAHASPSALYSRYNGTWSCCLYSTISILFFMVLFVYGVVGECDVKEYCKAFKLMQKQKRMGTLDEMVENDRCEICCDYPVVIEDSTD